MVRELAGGSNKAVAVMADRAGRVIEELMIASNRGVAHLLDSQRAGTWEQTLWTGTGFPKVFYLNYHYYRHYFPLMALGQYRTAVAPPR